MAKDHENIGCDIEELAGRALCSYMKGHQQKISRTCMNINEWI